MMIKRALVLLVVVNLAACGGGSDKGGDNNASSNPDGTWIQSCVMDEDGDMSSGKLVINGASWAMGGTVYSDTACADPQMTIDIEVITTYGSALTLSNGAVAIPTDHTITGIFMTPESQGFADGLNDAVTCGIATWAVGKLEDISACPELAGSIAVGDVEYDLYKVENNKLYFGDELSGDGLSPETRPTALDYGFFFPASMISVTKH